MDPLKIVIFIAAFALLLLLGRILSSSSEIHAASLPHPSPGGAELKPTEMADASGRPRPALTGAEIDFPVEVPPVILRDDGTYNRPNFLNYYFAKTDLLRGPDDPATFCDELSLEAQDPGNEQVWTYKFTVATPSGLRQVMDQEKFTSLFFDGGLVVVARWDLAAIMQAVAEEVIKNYSHKESL
ncbi:MAG TPA: hypothetical protein VIX19_08885 [Terriglobales bacterium]